MNLFTPDVPEVVEDDLLLVTFHRYYEALSEGAAAGISNQNSDYSLIACRVR